MSTKSEYEVSDEEISPDDVIALLSTGREVAPPPLNSSVVSSGNLACVHLFVEDRARQVIGVYRLAEGAAIIGRHPDAQIVLQAPEVSRMHARLALKGEQLTIEDLNSSSGTALDGARLVAEQPTEVAADARLSLGSYTLHVARGELSFSAGLPTVQILDAGAAIAPSGAARAGEATGPLAAGQASTFVPAVPVVQPVAVVPERTAAQAQLPPRTVSVVDGSPDDPLAALSERYRVIKPIGQGGMGQVFVVQERLSRRFVALKVLRADAAHNQNAVQQFVLEAIITARLQHPNILPIYDIGFLDQDLLYYTMRYVDGPSVRDLLALNGPPGQFRAATVIAQAADAIAVAHARNLMHLDLKPGNLLVDRNDHCYVLDWGLVREVPGKKYRFEVPQIVVPEESLWRPDLGGSLASESYMDDDDVVTQTLRLVNEALGHAIVGTPRYMAPEQARGEPEARSDLWALGLMLYEALTGIHPYTLLNCNEIPAIWSIDQIPPVAETAAQRGMSLVAPELGTLCDRALRQGPAFEGVADFAAAMWQVLRPAVRIAVPGPMPGPSNMVTAVESTTVIMNQPNLVQPDLAQPDLAQPDLVQPDLVQPDLAQPDLVQPDLVKGRREQQLEILARLASLPFYAVLERRRLRKELQQLS